MAPRKNRSAKPRPVPKAKATATKKVARPPIAVSIRAGGQRAQVFNSGLEVWLYDDGNLRLIRAAATKADPGAGGMPGNFAKSTKKGLVVGYSLYQDDGLDIEVHVGKPFTKQELAAGRWLEPQTALLELPSGALCVESNDASRLGPEPPGDRGAVVTVPPGNYRLTLYRVDHEALDREGITWEGPQEVVLLTPGGKAADAAADLLPFRQRRDNTWVGRYTIAGNRADVLVWLPDYWDTFFVNLDTKACTALGLRPGRYFRTHVPRAGLTMITAFATSWQEGGKLPPPQNVDLGEFGYGAVITPQDWTPNEALFCRRQATKTRAEDAVQNLWLPGTVEVLDERAHPPQEPKAEARLIELAKLRLFDDDFLAMVLSEVLPGAGDLGDLSLADALARVDNDLATLGLFPQGDIGWTQRTGATEEEIGARLYVGADSLAVILAAEANFELVFLTETTDGSFIATGITDALQRRAMRRGPTGIPVPHPKVRLVEADETLAQMRATHEKAVGSAARGPAPTDLLGAAQTLNRFFEQVVKG